MLLAELDAVFKEMNDSRKKHGENCDEPKEQFVTADQIKGRLTLWSRALLESMPDYIQVYISCCAGLLPVFLLLYLRIVVHHGNRRKWSVSALQVT